MAERSNEQPNEFGRACACAQRISDTLVEALALSESMAASMGKLAADPLLAAANRRATLNATIAASTTELGFVLQTLADRLGWQEMTVARMATVAPTEAAQLQALLAEINVHAARLRALDVRNRARGGRAIAFLRSALGTQAATVTAYDRRGALTAARPLSTGSRVI